MEEKVKRFSEYVILRLNKNQPIDRRILISFARENKLELDTLVDAVFTNVKINAPDKLDVFCSALKVNVNDGKLISNKKRQKEYRQTPKYREYQKTSKYKEYQKKYKKEYRKTPEYKEYQKEYRQTKGLETFASIFDLAIKEGFTPQQAYESAKSITNEIQHPNISVSARAKALDFARRFYNLSVLPLAIKRRKRK